MKQWKCSVCGYIHEGDEPPEKCPLCGAEKDKFVELPLPEEQEDPPTKAVSREESSMENQPQPQLTMMEKFMDFILQKHLHPISVHTPNGIIPIAVLFVFMALLVNSRGLADAAYYNMIAVLLSMPVVLLTGFVTWQKKYQGIQSSVFKLKIGASCFATVVLIGLVIWRTMQPDILSTASLDRWLFFLWSGFMLAAIGLAGHLGGQLVFAKKK